MTFIFIPENVPSSKNSKQWTGKFLVSSASVARWKKATSGSWESKKALFKSMLKDKEKPYKVGFHFVRKTRAKYDFVNPVQTIQDEMKAHGWIEDDNITEMVPIPLERDGSFWSVDSKKPGVYITVL